MKIDSRAFLPKARTEGIISKEVDGELLVYDLTRDKAHCLNETAAAVWQLCDGRTSVSAIAERLTEDRRAATASEQWAVGGEQQAEGSEQQEAERGSSPTVREGSVATPPVDAQLIWLALDQLRSSQLLEEKTFWPAAIPGLANMSRREVVRRLGLAAAIALPLVISITAPTAAEAAVSCGSTCHPCNSPIDCCGVCSSIAVPGCGSSTPRCI
jgi:hypothetical protein